MVRHVCLNRRAPWGLPEARQGALQSFAEYRLIPSRPARCVLNWRNDELNLFSLDRHQIVLVMDVHGVLHALRAPRHEGPTWLIAYVGFGSFAGALGIGRFAFTPILPLM